MPNELMSMIGTQLLPWTSNQATKGRNLHQSSKIYKRSSQKVQHGKSQTMKTPMSSSIKLDKDEKGKSIDSTMYRCMIVLCYIGPLVDPAHFGLLDLMLGEF